MIFGAVVGNHYLDGNKLKKIVNLLILASNTMYSSEQTDSSNVISDNSLAFSFNQVKIRRYPVGYKVI